MTPLQGLLCCQAPTTMDEEEAVLDDDNSRRADPTTSVVASWFPTTTMLLPPSSSSTVNKPLQDHVVVSVTEQESMLSGSCSSNNGSESPSQHAAFDFLPLVPFLSLAILSQKSSKDGGEDRDNDNNNVTSSKQTETETQAAVCLPNGIPAHVTFTLWQEDDDLAAHPSTTSQVFDPTVTLRYGKNLDSLLVSPELATSAEQLYQLLNDHRQDPSNRAIAERLSLFLTSHPEPCQVWYPHPSLPPHRRRHDRHDHKNRPHRIVYSSALAAICAVPSSGENGSALLLPLVQAAYAAYPEAIGMPDRAGYVPLHYAAAHHHTHVVTYLLSVFPAAVRHTIRPREHAKTALHLACGGGGCSAAQTPTAKSMAEACIAAIVQAYPASIYTSDAKGWTPLHYWVQNPHVTVRGIQVLVGTPPPARGSARHHTIPRTDQFETPLHLAVENTAVTVEILDALHRVDTSWVEQVDAGLQTCLHRALATHAAPPAVVQWLLDHYPAARHQYDDQGRRPQDHVTPATHDPLVYAIVCSRAAAATAANVQPF